MSHIWRHFAWHHQCSCLFGLYMHMHESCRTHAWVMSHTCMSRVTHMKARSVAQSVCWSRRHIWMMSRHTYAQMNRVTTHTCKSHVTLMHESRHIYAKVSRVMSHKYNSRVTLMHGSSHTYARVILHIWMRALRSSSNVRVSSTYRNRSRHTRVWVMPHLWGCKGARGDEQHIHINQW